MDTLRSTIEERGAKYAHIVLPDLEGTLRERRVAVAELETALPSSASFCNVLHQWDATDTIFGSGPFVGEPIAPDLSSIRGYPFKPNSVWIIADYTGRSHATSPRALLQTQIERAAARGFGVRAAFEFEFLVYEETANSIRAKQFGALTPWVPDNRCWDALSAAINADVVARMQEVLDAGDLPVASLGMELGARCLEATLGARGPLRAADDAAFFKLITKAFFRRRGLSACFMAEPDIAAPGLSGHIHLSLLDAQGRNLFRSAGEPSLLAERFSAGVLRLLPELLAMPLHTVNAYRRMSPGNWAPRTPTWAVENYSTAIRAVVGDHDAARLEFRIPGADVNPYLGLAMFLAAGIWGIEEDPRAPPLVAGDGRTEPPAGTAALPHDLLSAAKAMADSAVAHQLFGTAFVEHFVASRIHEFGTLRRAVSAAERARYFEAV